MMNRLTEESNQEHMCNVYFVEWENGDVEYMTGPICTGEHGNVVNPYLTDPFGTKAAEKLSKIYPGVKVRYMGLLHSHPDNRSIDNDGFSAGDALVATVSGKIYLTTPYGNVYVLDKWHGALMLLPSGFRELMVLENNYLRSNSIPESEWPVGLKWYMDNVLAEYDKKTRGGNFETIPANTYDVRH